MRCEEVFLYFLRNRPESDRMVRFSFDLPCGEPSILNDGGLSYSEEVLRVALLCLL